jgi:polyhydroxyalkanoate synthesis regulator phasin
MTRRLRLALALAGAGVVSAGAVAFAQAQGDDAEAERRAFLEDAAGRLGVEPDALESALEEAAIARIDALVEAGELDEEQARFLQERIRSGAFPLPGLRGGPGEWRLGPMHGGAPGLFHAGGPGLLEAASGYLGLGEDALRERLLAGESLAEIAEAEGRSVDGLKDVIVARMEARLDEAVEQGFLTRERADALLERMREHVDALVDGRLPRGPRLHRFGPGPWGQGPDSSQEDTSFRPTAA